MKPSSTVNPLARPLWASWANFEAFIKRGEQVYFFTNVRIAVASMR